MNAFLLDLRQALRGLRRSPAFALTSIATLALGISATTTLFTAIHGVLLKPLPYRDPDRLVSIVREHVQSHEEGSISAPDFRDLRESTASFEAMAIQRFRSFEASLTGRPERIQGLEVSAGYLEILGYAPALGSFFSRAHEEDGAGSAVLSYGLWMRAFGGDRGVVGRSLVLDGRPRTVLGVAPAETILPRRFRAQLFVPLDWKTSPARDRGDRTYRGVGRLRHGVSPLAAREELTALSVSLAERYPVENSRDWIQVARPLQDYLVGDRARPLLLLLGAVFLLHLVACANVANLFLARALGRGRETALRISLGSSAGQLFRHFLAEGLSIAAASALLGAAASALTVRSIPLWLPGAAELTGIDRLGFNPSVFGFVLALAVATSLFFALMPLLQAGRLNLQSELKEGGRSSSAAHGRLRRTLVAGEVALTTVLLMGSGLFLRSLASVLHTHPGFETRGVLTFSLRLPRGRYPDEIKVRSFHQELLRRIAALPGVESVGTACESPLGGENDDTSFNVGERARAVPPAEWPAAERDQVGGRYFETLRIPILKGRALTERDTVDSARVVVVSQSLAERYIEGDPIGQRIMHGQISDASPPGTWFEIVGVAADIRDSTLEKPPGARIYMPFAQVTRSYPSVLVRTEQSAASLRSVIQSVVASIDPELPVDQLGSLDDRARESASDRRQAILLLGGFSAVALILAGIGLYSVVAYLVTERRREFGIRLALGAQVMQVVRPVLGQGLRTVFLGAVTGLMGTVALGRIIASQLYGVTTFDPAALSAATLILIATGLLACLVPALRAASVDPAVVLREE